MRNTVLSRKTNETEINIELNIDGDGRYEVKSPIGFLTHMLETFAKFANIDLKIEIEGDLEVDQHHTIEDTGIVLGKAFKIALGNKLGINRSSYFIFPMDESLATVAIDIGGRPYIQYAAEFKRRFCGDLDTDLIEDFFQAFAINLEANIVIKAEGRSDHHKIEAIFKAFGKAMKTACEIDKSAKNSIPSTKGTLN
ncbi:imidazoleglycerol-phosphate dehydratase HisB [Candidatus Woesearchaeota archaeon]|nr:imidazoleglycerol-phosphate dehydratase HisB [Candidatus Woesearchaeota archaeon]